MTILDQINEGLFKSEPSYYKKLVSPVKKGMKTVKKLEKTVKKAGLDTLYTKAKDKYDRYMSGAIQKCRSSGIDTAKCVNMQKAKGLDIQINMLKSSMSQCNQTANPEKCRAKVGKKIQQLIKMKMKYITATKVRD